MIVHYNNGMIRTIYLVNSEANGMFCLSLLDFLSQGDDERAGHLVIIRVRIS